ncbi:hypothetical protein Misp01_46820 [Microtetraspora sp. NBRC 13810]|uniref:hypothetical protein n=1 Tax=Microtetraspora sp. NBRC 13810 TaxID=3030990 RepID=UPI0024A44221|nr:hypothetical protein [Microtetraspora sp. NBRC 13810]GLW09553.1 hypothetical protein Misp01_46820 [Microtetraspora sp. NBRC 13810]
MASRLTDDELAGLATRLRAADPGGWRESGLRELAAGLGWEWHDTGSGPVLRTGLAAGDARVRRVGKYEEDYADGRDHVGLYVPVEVSEGGPAAKADAFRRAADVLTGLFGPSPIMGVTGFPGPFYDSPAGWGSPFRRWRGEHDSLELHAAEDGPELVLHPNDPVEFWHWRQAQGNPHELGGFFGTRRDPANAGLGIPGMWRTDDWDVFAASLGSMLTTLPAETRALGIDLTLGLHGRIPGTYGPGVFSIACDGMLELAIFDEGDFALPHDRLGPLGWTSGSDVPATHDHGGDGYHSASYGPGEVPGHDLARMLVDTARLLGIESPYGLSLFDHAQSVDGYHVDYYALTLKENP